MNLAEQFFAALLTLMSGGTIWAVVFASRNHRAEQQHAALARLHDRRVKEFSGLWDAAGAVCTPNEKAVGASDKSERSLKVEQVESCFRGVQQWYRQHGILLDPLSRVWTMLLREETARWLRALRNAQKGASPEGSELLVLRSLNWDDSGGQWRKIWFIKTGLRILLETTVSEPYLRPAGRQHRTWSTRGTWRLRRRLRSELWIKHKIVNDLADPTGERRSANRGPDLPLPTDLVRQVLETTMGKRTRWLSALNMVARGMLCVLGDELARAEWREAKVARERASAASWMGA